MNWLVLVIGFVTGAASHLCWKYGLKQRWEAMYIWRQWPRCQCCNRFWVGLNLESSDTAYYYTGEWYNHKNPNRPILLCEHCAEEHHEYWSDMWSEYHSMVR